MGITIWPFIIVKHNELKKDEVLINHERIHLKQQLELFIVPFYIWYVLEWLLRFAQHKNAYLAYCHISFEREAYHHENNMDYPSTRKPYSFLKYL